VSRNKLTLKTISLTLAFLFLLSELSTAAPLQPNGVPQVIPPIERIAQDPASFEAPLDYCTLKEIHTANGQKALGNRQSPLIIHIQDAHSNLSGQQNLAGALDEIMSKYGVSVVLSEGGTSDCSLTRSKKLLPPRFGKKSPKII